MIYTKEPETDKLGCWVSCLFLLPEELKSDELIKLTMKNLFDK